VDLATGNGLTAALTGVTTVVDVSSVATTGRRRPVAYFACSTENLLSAERLAGVQHHIALSIVGTDQVGQGYYAGKRVQEALVRAGRVPHTIVRSTQFHEFAAQMLRRMSLGPIAVLPIVTCQPVAADEVAQLVVELVLRGPAGPAAMPQIAGPEVLRLAEMVRRLIRAQGRRQLVVPFRVPGRGGALMASGGLLPEDGRYTKGTTTFEAWLAAGGRDGSVSDEWDAGNPSPTDSARGATHG
jgi:uncharacterized protein YbjT (DUF2867 family)